MNDFMSVVEAVTVDSRLGFVINPDFMDLIPVDEGRNTVERILNSALQVLASGEVISVTYTPHFDMLLTIAVDGAGIIKIDASGSNQITQSELTEVIKQILSGE